MSERELDPVSSLVGYLHEITPRQAVKLARELCGQLEGEPESFHGGVWPGNVSLDVEGRAVLGRPQRTPARKRTATQAEYTAPEFFWYGDASAAADVYTVGLMLYAGCSGGLLPFQPQTGEPTDKDRADAMRRRMKGEPVTAPAGVSDGLKRVIEKALAYGPEDRYITAREMLTALNGVEEARQDPAQAAAASAAAMAGAAEILFAPHEDSPLPAQPAGGEDIDLEALLEDVDLEDVPEPAAEEPPAAEAPVIEETIPEGPVYEGPLSEGPEHEGPTPEGLAPLPEAEAAEDIAPEAEEDAGPALEEEAPVAEESAPEEPAEEASPEPPAPPEFLPETDGGWQKDGAAIAAAAAAAPLAEGVMDAPVTPPAPAAEKTPRPEYRVQKHFEKTAPVRAKKKRRSPAPFLWGAAALAILAGTGYLLFSGGREAKPEASAPFPTQDAADAEGPSASPLVITPHPAGTEAPAPTQAPGSSPSPEPAASTPAPMPTAPVTETLSVPAGGSGSTGNTGGSYSGGSTGGYTGGGNTGSNTGSGSSSGGGRYTVDPADDTVYITGIGVNVRSGPGTGYPIIGSVSTGDTLHRTGTSGGWSRVEFKGVTGYVSNLYAGTEAPATPTPAPTEEPAPPAEPVWTVTAEDLTYAQAMEAAEEQGGLAVVKTEEDLAALTETLADSEVDYLWLGVSYDPEEACWKWADGTVLAEDDPLWEKSPAPGHDGALLTRTEDGWKLVSLSCAGFDPASETYAGRLGYATAG